MPNQVLKTLDLNLLVALDALLSERSVTQAAARLVITQSAMSRTLKRLRDLFHDPLLVRTAQGMLPTPRAESLIQPLQRVLAEIEQVFTQPSFDPTTAKRMFSISTNDLFHAILLPSLLNHLSSQAPGIDLVIRTPTRDTQHRLATGELDLVISPHVADQVGFYQQRLFDERYVCMVRADHPLIGETLSLEEFVQLSHILIGGENSLGIIDRTLAEHHLARRIVLRLPTFLGAPLIVARSNLILTTPERFARSFSSVLPLRLLDPPLALARFSVKQLWHERNHQEPGHIWLRNSYSIQRILCADVSSTQYARYACSM
jgi:DNA-binding transcriptional LysR family regulator